jgi:hypothetical protein
MLQMATGSSANTTMQSDGSIATVTWSPVWPADENGNPLALSVVASVSVSTFVVSALKVPIFAHSVVREYTDAAGDQIQVAGGGISSFMVGAARGMTFHLMSFNCVAYASASQLFFAGADGVRPTSFQVGTSTTTVLFDPSSGEITHTHKVDILEGGKRPDADTLEREARRLAASVGRAEANKMGAVHLNSADLSAAFVHKIDPSTRRLVRLGPMAGLAGLPLAPG